MTTYDSPSPPESDRVVYPPRCRWCEDTITTTPMTVMDDAGHAMNFHPADDRPCYRQFRAST